MTSKTTYIIISVVVSFIVIFIFLLYYVLKSTTKDISEKEPYASILNKQLVTTNNAIYIKNTTHVDSEEYPYEIRNIDTSYEKHTFIPKGSKLEFNKAISIKGGTSGLTNSYLLGTLLLKDSNKKTPVVYLWGSLKTICLEEPCNYWEHEKAPWQTEIDTKKHFD